MPNEHNPSPHARKPRNRVTPTKRQGKLRSGRFLAKLVQNSFFCIFLPFWAEMDFCKRMNIPVDFIRPVNSISSISSHTLYICVYWTNFEPLWPLRNDAWWKNWYFREYCSTNARLLGIVPQFDTAITFNYLSIPSTVVIWWEIRVMGENLIFQKSWRRSVWLICMGIRYLLLLFLFPVIHKVPTAFLNAPSYLSESLYAGAISTFSTFQH